MNDRVADSVIARGFLLVLVICLHAAGAAALSRLPGPSWQGEEPPILRASWIPSQPPSSIQPAELHSVPPSPPPPRPAPERRVRPEVRPQAIRSEPAPEIVDAVPDVPIDPVASDDSTPASYSDVSAAVAASGATGGEEKNEEGSRGRAYVAPDVRADYLFKPDPKYPSLSLRLREQGLVKLRVHITEEGRAGEVTLHTSSGYERLDKSAIDSVKNHWRFRPAQRRGEPVASWEVVPVRFELQG